MSETYHFIIKTVCPVHLGCDEVYDPLSFYVDDKRLEVVCFSTLELIRQLEVDKLRELSAICKKGTISSLLDLYKFMSKVSAKGRRLKASEGFLDHYHKTLKLPLNNEKKISQELNRFIIWRTAFLQEDQRPYIPGSSIKGSLRTAYLNLLAKDKKLKPFRAKDAKKLEKTLLDGGQFNTDPFRCVKISDFMPIGDVKTRIVYAVNEKKARSRFQASGPYQIIEVIEPGSFFVGSISIEKPHPKAGIKKPITLKALLKSLDYFYVKEKKREELELEKIGIKTVSASHNGQGYPVRIGRHSGAECVTIDGHRSIKIKGAGWAKAATTFWLVSPSPRPNNKGGLLPFGWVSMLGPDPDMWNDLVQKEKLWKKEYEIQRLKKSEQIHYDSKKLHEEIGVINKLREDQERKIREEREKKAYLETLSPEDRAIYLLKEGGVSEQEVVEIYNRIDHFVEAKRYEIAAVLKNYWLQHGKWTGKLSKKQKKKVQKIKQILNEN